MPRRSCFIAWTCIVSSLVAVASVHLRGAEPEIVEQPDFTALERKNEMWRSVDPSRGLESNAARLRASGIPANEVEAATAQLKRLWSEKTYRDLEGFSAETVTAVREVDDEFLPRFRAARLRETTGVGPAGPSSAQLQLEWDRALLRAVTYEEIAQFRLMNGPSAKSIARALEGVYVSLPERKDLVSLQRSFDAMSRIRGGSRRSSIVSPTAGQELLDQYRIILGDERFAVFLWRAHDSFRKMHEAFAHDRSTLRATLVAWDLRASYTARIREASYESERERLRAEACKELERVVGSTALTAYAKTEDGRWLQQRPVRVASTKNSADRR
jgi:hypothetical protein